MSAFEEIWRRNLEAGNLQIPRCTHCQAWNWYPLPACARCQRRQSNWQTVPAAGTLYSWTRVHRSFIKARIELPYVVGLVDLDEASTVRLPCRFAGGPARLPAIGERVILHPDLAGTEGVWAYRGGPAVHFPRRAPSWRQIC